MANIWELKCLIYPEEGVEGSILHELSDDHHRTTLGHYTLQVDDIRVVKLAHDGCLTQEVPPLAFSVAHLQRLNSHQDLSLPRLPEVSTAHLPKLSCQTREVSGVFMLNSNMTYCMDMAGHALMY